MKGTEKKGGAWGIGAIGENRVGALTLRRIR